EVKIIMTESAASFISPLTLSTLSKNEVITKLSDNESWNNHVILGRWADLFVLAPLSCNTLSKMAHGLCDNALMAVYLSATCKVMVAPAMDEDMHNHPTTKANLLAIESFGNIIIPSEFGELASGLTGNGRMAEPENILNHIKEYLFGKNQFTGKKVLITAGPTFEPIDPVRFIGNHSSGKMGIALANEFISRGAEVNLVIGPVSEKLPEGCNIIKVNTAKEMYDECIKLFPEVDIAVMSAAVADYKVINVATEKIKKSDDKLTLELEKNDDILKHLGKIKKNQILVGFALETNNEEENALKKLKDKNADFIVLNSLNDKGAGFGTDTNKIVIFAKDGSRIDFKLKSKNELAADIINTLQKYAKN
ncbi:MAG: bifunctional phosphopantothenoylcysteine decarboxylase/phosphopantothenate--cysteine ligase CoaBC, partial [Ferruginibacter sp.]